jgi:hypothetical protein
MEISLEGPQKIKNRAGGVAQVVKHLTSKWEAPNLNSLTTKNPKNTSII